MKDTQPASGPASFPAPYASGPAFPLGVKLLATVLVAYTLYWGVRSGGGMLASREAWAGALLSAVCLVLVVWTLFWMWRSRTSVDAEGITQTWIWNKRVRWADIGQSRLIGLPGLQWLVAPRLMVRPRGGGVLVFHSADRAVLAVFASFVTVGSPLIPGAPRVPGADGPDTSS